MTSLFLQVFFSITAFFPLDIIKPKPPLLVPLPDIQLSDSFPLKMADCNADDTLAQLQYTKLLNLKALIKLQIPHKSYVYGPLLSVL
jgi:hypothetical protein